MILCVFWYCLLFDYCHKSTIAPQSWKAFHSVSVMPMNIWRHCLPSDSTTVVLEGQTILEFLVCCFEFQPCLTPIPFSWMCPRLVPRGTTGERNTPPPSLTSQELATSPWTTSRHLWSTPPVAQVQYYKWHPDPKYCTWKSIEWSSAKACSHDFELCEGWVLTPTWTSL